MKIKRLVKRKTNHDAGFTIIEVTIAVAIFSVVLLAIIFSMAIFFSFYHRSTVISATQNAVQNITDTIEQSIRYSSLPPVFHPAAGTVAGTLCSGGEEFVYFGGEEEPTETNSLSGQKYALYQLPEQPGCAPSWAGGKSLLGDNYRVINFQVTPLISPADEYLIDLKIAYTAGGGDNGDDLLCSPSISPATLAGGCSPQAANLANFTMPDITCKNGVGSQYCYVTELQSIIESRFM